jgi:hypothetical protein
MASSNRGLALLNAPLCAVAIILLLLLLSYLESHAEIGILSLVLVALFVGYIVTLIYFAVRSIVACFQRRFLFSIGQLAAALILALGLLFGRQLADLSFFSIDYARLLLSRSYFDREVQRQLEVQNAPPLVSFNWGSGGFLATNFFYTLVYDRGAEIALIARDGRVPNDAALAKYIPMITADRCTSRARHLTGYFYTVSTVCQ